MRRARRYTGEMGAKMSIMYEILIYVVRDVFHVPELDD